MKIRKTMIILLLAAAVQAACPGPASAQRIRKDSKDKKDLPALKETRAPQWVFSRIERAWNNSDAGAISAVVGKKKVLILMKGVADGGGYYSKSQVFFLMKKMFKEFDHMKFEFVRYHNLDRPDRKVFAIAYRTYKNIRSNRVYQDKVYITLGKEGDDWVVTEIKTAR